MSQKEFPTEMLLPDETTGWPDDKPDRRILNTETRSMFNEAWIGLAFLLTFIGLVTSVPALITIAACLVTTILFCWLYNHWSLAGLEYRRKFDRQRVFPGEMIEMSLEITNRKILPLSWVLFQDELPLNLTAEEVQIYPSPESETTGYFRSAFSVRWFERVQRTYHLYCQQRGRYYLGPVTVETGDLFTLFTTKQEWLLRDPIIVYPQIWPLEELGFATRAPFGEIPTRNSLIQDPTLTRGIRDYRPEDSFRHVHWKASARRSKLQTRVYQPTTDMNLMIALNVATTPKIWLGVRPDLLERAIVVAASIANYAAEKKWTLGLISNGVPRSDQAIKVPAGRAPDQLTHILEALSGLTAFSTSSIEELLRVESPRIPLGATLALVTAITTDEMLATLIQLKKAGRRVALISLADDPPQYELEGIMVHHLPQDSKAFTKMTAVGSLENIPTPQPIVREPLGSSRDGQN
ncbi:MAG: DUF58 domain-containing protein [Anaerolineales bacterium]|nr:DUF58 domain-containing protein [Anaerolineales bacterium]